MRKRVRKHEECCPDTPTKRTKLKLPARFTIVWKKAPRRKKSTSRALPAMICQAPPGCTYLGQVEIEGVLYCEYICPGPSHQFVRC